MYSNDDDVRISAGQLKPTAQVWEVALAKICAKCRDARGSR